MNSALIIVKANKAIKTAVKGDQTVKIEITLDIKRMGSTRRVWRFPSALGARGRPPPSQRGRCVGWASAEDSPRLTARSCSRGGSASVCPYCLRAFCRLAHTSGVTLAWSPEQSPQRVVTNP